MTKKAYLTPTEVAKLLMVSPVTVRQWAQRGLLPALNTPGGHRRFLTHEVERFARTQGLTLQTLDHDGMLRVLVVDDDKAFARYLNRLLTNANERVVVEIANDGFEAGAKIQTFQPHVLLLDLMMDALDGFDVCKQIKKNPITKQIRVIAITALEDPNAAKRVVRYGAEVCLQKPFKGEELLALIGIEKTAPSTRNKRTAVPA